MDVHIHAAVGLESMNPMRSNPKCAIVVITMFDHQITLFEVVVDTQASMFEVPQTGFFPAYGPRVGVWSIHLANSDIVVQRSSYEVILKY